MTLFYSLEDSELREGCFGSLFLGTTNDSMIVKFSQQ